MKTRLSFLFIAAFALLVQICKAQQGEDSNHGYNAPSEFEISECLTGCSIRGEVITSTLVDSSLNIKVGAHLNCSVGQKSKITYALRGDTLNIIVPEFQVKRDTIISKTDSTQTIQISESKSSTECNCFFHIKLTIGSCKSVPTTVLVNGNTLAQNYRRRTIIVKDE